MRVRMTYEEALQYLEEALKHRLKLLPGTEMFYLVNAQAEQLQRLVEAFKKYPDKKVGCNGCST